jgi:oxazoline/thiazoline dehydrogenase
MPEEVTITSCLSSIRLEPAEAVKFECADGKWTITQAAFPISFHLAPGATYDILEEIRGGGVFLDKLTGERHSAEAGGRPAEQIGRLWRQGLLVKAIYDGDDKVAVLHNYGEADFLPEPPTPSDQIVMTEDTCLHTTGGKLLVESVSCGAYLLVMSERLMRVPIPWVRPMRCCEWAAGTALPQEVILALASCLESMGAIRRIGADLPAPVRVPEWSFADRMLHARSRLGRHIGEYGRKSPLHATRDAVGVSAVRTKVGLPAPVMSELIAKDRPFAEVLENRRSLREYGNAPLSSARLSEFLYRAARVTGRLGTGADEITLRPYPSGGGLHELEIYPLIHRCSDLRPGLYRYDPSIHCLEEIAGPCPETVQLLADARRSSRMACEPQVLLLVAAKFARVTTKYESVAYTLILKNLGGLFQTMYLVATAMGLAPCALGGGNSDVFCRVAGTEFWRESTVGEFLLGEGAAACPAQN